MVARGHAWLPGACMVVRGHVWLPWGVGGVHGCPGVGLVAGGHVWLPGACMVVGGVHGCQGHAWLPGGVHGCQGEGACVVGRGVHGIRRDTVNEQAVRILLECILIYFMRLVPF